MQTADLHNRRESARLIVDITREFPGEVRLLTLGPLSNLIVAADFDRELSRHLHSLVVLGGSVQHGGDVTAASEFNIWSDSQAARAVCGLPVHRTLVPLDVSGSPVLTFEDVDTLCSFIGNGTPDKFVSGLLRFALRAYRRHLALEGIPLHAVAALCGGRGGSFSNRKRHSRYRDIRRTDSRNDGRRPPPGQHGKTQL